MTITDAVEPPPPSGQLPLDGKRPDPPSTPSSDRSRDAAPKRKSRPTESNPPRPVGRPPKPNLQEKLTEQITMLGMAVGAAGMRGMTILEDGTVVPSALTQDGMAIVAGAPRLARSLVKLANENPAVKKALERLVTVSAYGELFGAVAAIAIPIAANHKLLPPEIEAIAGAAFGGPPS